MYYLKLITIEFKTHIGNMDMVHVCLGYIYNIYKTKKKKNISSSTQKIKKKPNSFSLGSIVVCNSFTFFSSNF